MKYCVYIIYSIKLDKFYVGETSDFKNRLEEHKTGFYKNSFTAKAQDWELFFKLDCKNKSQAIRIEKHIKSMKSKNYFHNLNIYPEISKKLKERF
jgi:putative endonuclease